jgi:protein transport protein SEC20
MDLQDYLKDLLTIDCDIQTKLQQLSSIKSYNSLEQKSNEIKTLLKDYKQKLNEIKDVCSLIQSRNSNKLDLYLNELKIQTDHFNKLEIKFRNEYYASQKRLETFERDSLLSTTNDNSGGDARQRKNIDKEILYSKSKTLNENLGESSRTIKSSLEQSNLALHKLQTSSDSLKQTHNEFDQMSSNISDSKRLLIKFERREFTNKLLFMFSLCLFFSVVLYILWKRLF